MNFLFNVRRNILSLVTLLFPIVFSAGAMDVPAIVWPNSKPTKCLSSTRDENYRLKVKKAVEDRNAFIIKPVDRIEEKRQQLILEKRRQRQEKAAQEKQVCTQLATDRMQKIEEMFSSLNLNDDFQEEVELTSKQKRDAADLKWKNYREKQQLEKKAALKAQRQQKQSAILQDLPVDSSDCDKENNCCSVGIDLSNLTATYLNTRAQNNHTPNIRAVGQASKAVFKDKNSRDRSAVPFRAIYEADNHKSRNSSKQK